MEINHSSDTITPSSNILNVIGALQQNGINIPDFNTTNVYNGFVDSTQVTITRNNATRQISIAPTGASYDIYVKGVKFTKSTTETITVPNTTQISFIYFDNTGTLQQTTTFDGGLLLRDNAYVCNAYWNVAQAKFIFVGLEFHSYDRNWLAHLIRHRQGASYFSGFSLTGFVVDGDGSSNTHAQFTCDAGVFDDEDIRHSWGATTSFDVFYRIGATNWQSKNGNTYPFILSGEESYTGANGRICYNQLNGANYQLTQVQEGFYTTVSLFAINDSTEKVVAFLGINEYSTVALARAGAINELGLISSTLPFQEFIPIGVVILQSSSAYTNTPKARIVSTDTGASYFDLRLTTSYVVVNTSNSHLTLGDTTNDACHPQYLLKNTLTTKGDILTHDGTNPVRLPISPNTYRILGSYPTVGGATVNYFTLGNLIIPAREYYFYEDFTGGTITAQNNWLQVVAGAGAAVTIATQPLVDERRHGVMTLSTGNTATGRCSYHNGLTNFTLGTDNGYFIFDAIFYVPTLSTATQEYTLEIGLGDNTGATAQQTNGVYLRYDRTVSTNWLIVTSASATRTSTTTTTAVETTNWHWLRMVVDGTVPQVDFYMDTVSIGSITTNLPLLATQILGFLFKIRKTVGTTASLLHVDSVYQWHYRPNFLSSSAN